VVGSKIVVVILRATGYYYLMSAATAYSVRPFSGPKYHENAERAYSADLIPCAICGKGVKDLAKAAKAVVIDEIWETVRAKLKALLKGGHDRLWNVNDALSPLNLAPHGVTVILVAGVNGVGKTTSIAKLANLFKKHGKAVVLAAGDTFRAAAVEQLTLWSQRLGCEIVTKPSGSDPAAVAFAGCAKALETNADVLIVDTAGRLQTQQNLMKQLSKIQRVISEKIPGAPHEVLLVLDATTGQNGVSQAQHFSQSVSCSGLILAKLDGTAKGGIVLAIRQQMNLPVKYVGVGEQIDDLELFDPDGFVDALFDLLFLGVFRIANDHQLVVLDVVHIASLVGQDGKLDVVGLDDLLHEFLMVFRIVAFRGFENPQCALDLGLGNTLDHWSVGRQGRGDRIGRADFLIADDLVLFLGVELADVLGRLAHDSLPGIVVGRIARRIDAAGEEHEREEQARIRKSRMR